MIRNGGFAFMVSCAPHISLSDCVQVSDWEPKLKEIVGWYVCVLLTASPSLVSSLQWSN